MTLQNIDFNRKNLTIMGVKFPDLETLDSVATALASQMYEGFKPTKAWVETYRDYRVGKISKSELLNKVINVA